METNITCAVCGGTSFYKDSGFYYCNECQTQSQDIQERVFAIEEETVAQPTAKQKSSKRIRSEKKNVDRLTTWECYNYILRGLVEELIQLGADVKLKNTVHILWFQYLNVLQVTKNTSNDLPKLGAVNMKLDAEVIYKRSFKRKRKPASRTPSPSDSATNDSPGSRREQSKKRRSFILSEYHELNSTLQSEDVSLSNKSLTSLKSNSDASAKETEKYLQYNKFARKELLKNMNKCHLKKHVMDVVQEFHCHKPSYRMFSTDYAEGPATLSRMKIYSLLYLALLINKDSIQLGDLIRFVREGHLSYHNVNHFYPEDFDLSNLNLKSWNEKHILLSHYKMRKLTAKLAHFLDVTNSVPMQNLVELCRRYCQELNLPDEIWGYSLNFISLVLPQMKFTKASSIIPNYEGRAMSIIIFFLKLMFGLDDETEHYFSKSTEEINNNNNSLNAQKMFVWDEWSYYIQYRKLLLKQHHFPSQYLFDNKNVENVDLFTSFIMSQDAKFETEVAHNRETEVIQQLLMKYKEKYCNTPNTLTFPSTLTPFRNYSEILANSDEARRNHYLTDVLNSNFNSASIKFLINPFNYFKQMYGNYKIGIKHRGVNNKIKVVKYKNLKVKRQSWRYHTRKELFVHLRDTAETKTCHIKKAVNLEDVTFQRYSKGILKNFENANMNAYEKHLKQLLQKSTPHKKDTHKPSSSQTIYTQTSQKTNPSCLLSKVKENVNFHYITYERYLLKNINVKILSMAEFNDFFIKFPKSFKAVVKECARITEQEVKELYEEFSNVEIYVCYVAKWTDSDQSYTNIVNPDLRVLMNSAIKNW